MRTDLTRESSSRRASYAYTENRLDSIERRASFLMLLPSSSPTFPVVLLSSSIRIILVGSVLSKDLLNHGHGSSPAVTISDCRDCHSRGGLDVAGIATEAVVVPEPALEDPMKGSRPARGQDAVADRGYCTNAGTTFLDSHLGPKHPFDAYAVLTPVRNWQEIPAYRVAGNGLLNPGAKRRHPLATMSRRGGTRSIRAYRCSLWTTCWGVRLSTTPPGSATSRSSGRRVPSNGKVRYSTSFDRRVVAKTPWKVCTPGRFGLLTARRGKQSGSSFLYRESQGVTVSAVTYLYCRRSNGCMVE